ncbi:glycosyltransferase [Lyngbya aestuarii]|uniref:glycosyltransferase n=1 Tax=Lyngbya aestuarii TaxID=118322 RepID=UPI00403DDFA7
MPKISVLMSVYNAGEYLAKAVGSILTQTFKDFEFIIIDDGSTDKSLAILERYAKQDSRIRLISQQNIGLTKTLNKALALAQGEFIARMDADDISMPERFNRQVQYLENNPNCVALGCDVLQIDMDGAPICKMGVLLSHDELEAELLKGRGGVIRHPAVMIRREALVAINGYRDQFKTAQDLDLYLRLAERGQLANLPDVLLEYRLHLESVNFAKYERQTQDVIAMLEDAYAKRNLKMPEGVLQRRFKKQVSTDHHRFWAQMALKERNISTARKHAFLSLHKDPFSLESWQMMLRTIKRSIKNFQLN